MIKRIRKLWLRYKYGKPAWPGMMSSCTANYNFEHYGCLILEGQHFMCAWPESLELKRQGKCTVNAEGVRTLVGDKAMARLSELGGAR